MSIISIDSFEDLKIYLKNNKFFKDLYIREINNSLKGNTPRSSSYIYFLIKCIGFIYYHFLLTLRTRIKFKGLNKIYLSPDFFFDKDLGFHRYWENLDKSIDLTQVEFVYFSNLKTGFFQEKSKIKSDIFFFYFYIIF